MSTGQRYTSEFKREAVKLAQSSNTPISAIAQELGIHYKILYSWVRANMEKKSPSKPKYLHQDYEALLTENAELKRKLKRAEQEREIKKSGRVLCSRKSVKYEFIKENSCRCAIRLMCETLNVSKSGYYEWLKMPLNKREKRNLELDALIKRIFYEHKCRYGSTRIYKELKAREVPCTRDYIAKGMLENALIPKAKRKFKATTDSNHNKCFAPNLLAQDFYANLQNQKWTSDITYISTQEGWLYLCVFIDLYSRAVIGWSMSERLKSTLVEDALKMALLRRRFPKDVITHSDRGIQYCSESYQNLLKENQLICSMSATGCCYDNAAMESFFHTLKIELVHDENYKTRKETKTSIVEYIECYYNRKRRHSTIGYITPLQFEINSGYAA